LGANLLLRTIGGTRLVDLKMDKLVPVEVEKQAYSTPISHEAFETVRNMGTSVDIKPGASVDGMKDRTKGELIILTNELGGKITLTEGTGGEHASGEYSHTNGYKADVRSLDPITRQPNILTKYIESVPSGWKELKKGDVNGDCFTNECYLSPRGAIYNKEDDHWDVLVK